MRPIGRLVDVDHLVEEFQALDAVVRRGMLAAPGCSLRDAALYSVSIVRVDLPPPETPVMQVSVPSGIAAVTFFRLLPLRADDLQPAIVHRLAALGGHAESAPGRRDIFPSGCSGWRMMSSGVPSATMWPPWMPAPGPMSIT